MELSGHQVLLPGVTLNMTDGNKANSKVVELDSGVREASARARDLQLASNEASTAPSTLKRRGTIDTDTFRSTPSCCRGLDLNESNIIFFKIYSIGTSILSINAGP